jgi:predicted nucleic acid-binding protein
METYVLDASALVDIYNHFQGKFRKLKPLVENSRIRIPEGVFRELRRVTGRLYKIVESWMGDNPDCIVRIDRVHNLASELVRIEQQYGERIQVGRNEHSGFWKSPSGRKAADGQVVAVAKVLGCTVVSDDYAVRLVCMLEGIPCVGWTEFVRQASSNQLRLF